MDPNDLDELENPIPGEGEGDTPPGEGNTPPGDKVVEPGDKVVEPGDKVVEPGDKVVEPGEGEGDDKPLMMPKSRYDSVKSRLTRAEQERQELAARLAKYEQDKPTKAPEAELDEKLEEIYERHAKAVSDGDHKAAAAAMREASAAERSHYQAQLQTTGESVSAATKDAIKYDARLSALEEAHPEINPDSEQFDEDLLGEIAELVGAFEAKGYKSSEALKRAASYALKTAPGAPEGRQTDVARNLRTANAQPSSMSKAGMDSDKAGGGKGIDIMSMTEEEFEALDEATLAKMRGDFG